MKYTARSFTVPASGNAICTPASGHAMPDVRGKCIRCGENASTPPEPYTPEMQVTEWPSGSSRTMHYYAKRGMPCE